MTNPLDEKEFADLQQRFSQMGYQMDQLRIGYVVNRLDDSVWARYFTNAEQLRLFEQHLQRSSTWQLDLEHGHVHVDRKGNPPMVIPNDGSKPFSITHPLINGYSGTVPPGDHYRYAEQLFVSSASQSPPLGGAWHKVV